MKRIATITSILTLSMLISCDNTDKILTPDVMVEDNISSITWFGDSRKIQSYIGGEMTLYFSVNTNDGEVPNGEVDLESFTIYSGGIETKALPTECEGLSVTEAEYDIDKRVLEVSVSVDTNTSGYGETYLVYRDGIRSDGFELHISDLKLEDFLDPNLDLPFSEWIIVDEDATSEDFESLKDKLEGINSSVDVFFPYLTELPAKAFYYAENLSSVSLPVATTIGESAFYSKDINTLRSISVPMVDEASLLDGEIYPDKINEITLTVGEHINVSGNSLLKVESGNIINRIGSFASIVGGTSDSSIIPLYQEIAYSEISEDNYPDGDYWSITGCTTLERSNNICDALMDANDKGRKISILIEDLTTLGDYAFWTPYPSALSYVSLPKATYVGSETFFFCDALESVVLPSATLIEDSAFRLSRGITYLEVASAPSVTYSQSSGDWGISNKSEVPLTTNSINKELFSTWGFKEVIVENK